MAEDSATGKLPICLRFGVFFVADLSMILFAEDDVAGRTVVSQILRSLGYQVIVASAGETGFKGCLRPLLHR